MFQYFIKLNFLACFIKEIINYIEYLYYLNLVILYIFSIILNIYVFIFLIKIKTS